MSDDSDTQDEIPWRDDLSAKYDLPRNVPTPVALIFKSLRPVQDPMMSRQIEARNGYVRCHAGLRLIDSSAVAPLDEPDSGYLDLLTEDGRLRLIMSYREAEHLMIDLRHFLAS